jgi:hypothetical protein
MVYERPLNYAKDSYSIGIGLGACGLLRPHADRSAYMATCARCNTQESQISDNGQPLCTGCLIRQKLTQQVLERTSSKTEALRKFESVMLRFPTRMAQAEGIEQIKSASNELNLARKDMARAYTAWLTI